MEKKYIIVKEKRSVHFCETAPSKRIVPQKAGTVTAVTSGLAVLAAAAPESPNVSAHHPVPSWVTGRVHHFVPTTVARQTKQLVPCAARHDSF